MKYLIDTNVISEIRKGARCNANVARWWRNVLDHELYLSVLVLGEIRKGIQLARRRSTERARTLELWLSDLRRAFDDRLLDVDRDIADEWGHMSGLRNVATIDGLLAATAKVRRMTLVQRCRGLGRRCVESVRRSALKHKTKLTASKQAGADTTARCPAPTGGAVAQPLQCSRRETLDYKQWLRSLSKQGTKRCSNTPRPTSR